MVNWRAFCLMIFLSIAFCVSCVHGQSPQVFHWLDQKRDAALWASIEQVFQDQLKATRSDNVETYGYLKRVGVFGDTALVIVAHRMVNDPQGGDQYSSASNYDIAAKSISKIEGLDYMWYWQFFNVAQFEPSPTPDVLFTYNDCTGCEADKILTALRYNPSAHQWQIRRWTGPKDWTTDFGLIVESASEPDDPLISDDDLNGLVDLESNGFDDVALRSRWISKRTPRHVDDRTLLYGAKNGIFVGKVVSNKREQMKVWSKLCVNSRNRLCKGITAAH